MAQGSGSRVVFNGGRTLRTDAAVRIQAGNPPPQRQDSRTDRTEIDMKLGDLMVEAKLTEADFRRARG